VDLVFYYTADPWLVILTEKFLAGWIMFLKAEEWSGVGPFLIPESHLLLSHFQESDCSLSIPLTRQKSLKPVPAPTIRYLLLKYDL
jgi:hypothetical protein